MMMKLCFLMYQQARGLTGVNNAEQEHTEAVSLTALPRVVCDAKFAHLGFFFSLSLNFPD